MNLINPVDFSGKFFFLTAYLSYSLSVGIISIFSFNFVKPITLISTIIIKVGAIYWISRA